MRRHKKTDDPTMDVRRRDGASDVPSQAPTSARLDDFMPGRRRPIDTSPEAVRVAHAAMYRRLRRHMELHRGILSDDAWRLLTRVAFALYVDSAAPDSEFVPLSAVLAQGGVTSRSA